MPTRYRFQSFHVTDESTNEPWPVLPTQRPIVAIAIAGDSDVDIADIFTSDAAYPRRTDTYDAVPAFIGRKRISNRRPWFGKIAQGDTVVLRAVRSYPAIPDAWNGGWNESPAQRAPVCVVDVFYEGDEIPTVLERADMDVVGNGRATYDASAAASAIFVVPTQGRTLLGITGEAFDIQGGGNMTVNVYGMTSAGNPGNSHSVLLATRTLANGGFFSDEYSGCQWDAIRIEWSVAGTAQPHFRVYGTDGF